MFQWVVSVVKKWYGTFFIVLLAGYCQSLCAMDYSAWSNNINVLLNTSSSGAATALAVTNFPVLIRLTQANFTFSQAKAGGADLRFAKTNGTPLPYEIERWDATNQIAEIWVKVDTVFPGQAARGFVMYWGNASAASESNGKTVFDTANGFVGVWHMDDTTDATAHGVHANKVSANQPATATGIVGNAFDFNGSSDNMVVPFSQSLNVGRQITVNFWARYDGSSAPATYNRLICRKNTWTDVKGWDIDLRSNSNTGLCILTNNSQGYNLDNVVSNWSQNAWHFISVSYDLDSVRVYGDGVKKPSYFGAELQDSTEAHDNIIDSVRTFFVLDPDTFWTTEYIYDTNVVTQYGPLDCRAPILFGSGDGTYFNGALDEIRYEKGARSDDWIKLCYENQKADQSLVAIGGQISVKQHDFRSGKNVNLFVPASGMFQVRVFDMCGRMVLQKNFSGPQGTSEFQKFLSSIHKEKGEGVYLVKIDAGTTIISFNTKMTVTL